ncbi:uncharacterized protein LOC129410971 [Boleophthalmus pectinirostris]|uniref:uncharacterized protein LOC129410971 n=1 Tax=Boleophthalmus pectinirostris TaxID=150288 RepID=UPI0024311292|nr:uncharacterized protein LOC129410971 [Boleophthalmus pectinirostris]
MKGQKSHNPTFFAKSPAPLQCSLSEDHRADVLLLLDRFNHISSEDFSKVKDFLVALVQILGVVGLDSVQIALVKCGGKPEIEFYLNTYHDLPSVVSAVRKISQSPASPGNLTTDAVESVVETIFHTDQGDRLSAPDVLIVISDRNSSSINRDTVKRFWSLSAKVFIVGVKGADYSELKDIDMDLDKPEFYTVKDFSGFSNTLRELTQSFCRWIKQKLDQPKPESLSFFDIQPRRARVSWTFSGSSEVWEFSLETKPYTKLVAVPGYERTTELLHLKPNTSYEIFISAFRSGWSASVTGRLTTPPDSMRLSGGPGRCSGSLEVHTDQLWSSVCAEGFGQTEAEIICRELDCGGVSDLQGALITEGSVVGRSFHCSGAEAALKDCESSETLCSAAANITCTDDVLLWLNGHHCYGFLHLRHQDQWRPVMTSDQDLDLDFGSALCQNLGCGLAVKFSYFSNIEPFWWLDPECVKRRVVLRDCLISNKTQDKKSLWLICSDFYPGVKTLVSSEGVFQSRGHRALVRSGADFSVSCFLDKPFYSVFFHLLAPSGNYTLPSVNHSAHFLFTAFGPEHTGNYTCGYSEDNSSEIMKNVTLYIGRGVADSDLLLRAGIHVLILLISTTALYFYCQAKARKQRGQRRSAHLHLQ